MKDNVLRPSLLRPSTDAAFDAWSALVRANREQVERLREGTRGSDFWATRAAHFRPGEMQAVEVPYLLALARPEDAWLDIGAGGGRFAVPLARHVERLIAVEPSPAMREVLNEAAAEARLENLSVQDVVGPPAAAGDVPACDVALAANVIYAIEDIRAFVEAMERHARRLCVVIVGERAPSTADEPLWTALHGAPLASMPALREFAAVLWAWGRSPEVRTFVLPPPEPVDLDEALRRSRRLYWVREGSAKDRRLRELLQRRYGLASGLVALPPRLRHTAAVTWAPERAG